MNFSQRELDEARLELLRRRVTSFGTVVGLLLMALAGLQWVTSAMVLSQSVGRPGRVGMFAGVLVGLALVVMPRVRRRRYNRTTLRGLVWRTIWIVSMSALSQTPGAATLSAGISEALRPFGFEGNLGPIFVLVLFMVVLHTAAAIVVPWTVGEACVPPAIWAGLTLAAGLSGRDSSNMIVFGVGLTLLAGLPGVTITLFRAGGLRESLGLRLIGARYAEVERELSFARRLHERLFPTPVREGAVRLEYAYEPMRQIGGDFLDVSRGTDGSLLAVVIDVTGHGVAAALAVNRLHGEMKRQLAEKRDSSPGEVVTALNRYINLTLADESVFATAVVARVWGDGRARLCVAGHPPPLLRGADGLVSTIDPTAAILGPFDPEEFAADETEIVLGPGVTLVLYTDGAIECRDVRGRDLGQRGLERLTGAAANDDDLPRSVLAGVSRYRAGAAEDDVLIAALGVVSPT